MTPADWSWCSVAWWKRKSLQQGSRGLRAPGGMVRSRWRAAWAVTNRPPRDVDKSLRLSQILNKYQTFQASVEDSWAFPEMLRNFGSMGVFVHV